MQLPKIIIEFKSKAQSVITRSERGIVAVILKDDTEGAEPFKTYKSLSDVDFTKMSEDNYNYMKLIFQSAPYKVMVVTIPTTEESISKSLEKLAIYKWNYLTVPCADAEMTTVISSWIKEQRTKNKTFKAVLANVKADNEGIINFTSDKIVSTITGEDKTLTAYEYCARIAGIIAGLSLSRSLTYYVLDDVVDVELKADADTAVESGELIVIFDGEKYKIGRGINSLTNTKNEDLKKIKIIEGKDMVFEDIKTTFEDKYTGQVINDYDHKQELVAAIITYFKSIEGDVLDVNYDNSCSISLDQQRDYLETSGVDTESYSDVQILQANTGSNVYLESSIKFVDAMEDLKMLINM